MRRPPVTPDTGGRRSGTGRGCVTPLPPKKGGMIGMGRTALLLVSTALAIMLSAGVALALNAVDCEGGGIRCVGTDRPDLVRGSDDLDAIYGRDGGDILKGRGEGDALLGHKGDELLGGPRQDFLIGGVGDDGL